jgi:dimethylaniline monooxygenase (N-oxide forming)
VFWSNGVGGVLHHPDTFDLIAANVQVYRAKVKSLHRTEVYLDDDADTHFPCDALLCGTGYERDFSHFTIKQRKDLGLPYPKSLEDPVTNKKWEDLVHTADKQILSRFMILRDPPPHTHLGESRTPYRLYNGIASLTDPSIVFLNHVTFANKTAGAEIQAMWATAYFDGNVVIPPISERERNVATWIAWNKRRYLSNGELGVNLTLDVVPYIDVLMKEMGLTRHKGKGWLRDFFAPVLPADLGRAWKEYLEKVRK